MSAAGELSDGASWVAPRVVEMLTTHAKTTYKL